MNNYKKLNNEIIESLKRVKILSTHLLSMDYEECDRMTLVTLKILIKRNINKDKYSINLYKNIKSLLKEYPKGNYPNDYTLIELLKNKSIDKIDLPMDYFSQLILLFEIYYNIMENDLVKLCEKIPYRTELMYLNSIRNILKGIFIRNPNFKASENNNIPYYKRNINELFKSNEISLQYLCNEIDSYMNFLEENLEYEIPEDELLDMNIPLEKRHLKRKKVK